MENTRCQTLIVVYNYFDAKGNQLERTVVANTIQSLITKMRKYLMNEELYHYNRVSPNLVDYDFKQHGDEFKGWAQ